MIKKMTSDSGTSRLILILGIVAIGLVVMTVMPFFSRGYEASLQKSDEDYVTAASQLAENMFGTSESDMTLIYDSVNKTFVSLDKVISIEPYSSSKLHDDEFVVVQISRGDDIKCSWMNVDQINKLATQLSGLY